jgi:hypothetical protein
MKQFFWLFSQMLPIMNHLYNYEKNHLCYIVWNGYWILLCFSSKGSLPPFGKKPKGVGYRMPNRKIPENKNVLHAAILQLTKGTLISL